MAIELVSLKCPECGQTLSIEENRPQAFCTYCGAKVIIHNDNEHIYRTIDEAGIKQAETERIIMLKQMELQDKQNAAHEKRKSQKIRISIVLGILSLLMLCAGFLMGSASGDPDSGWYAIACVGFFPLLSIPFIWTLSGNKESETDFGDKAKVPSSVSEYDKKSYTALEAILRSAGFTNIKCIPMNDLTFGLIKKPGLVDSLTINGESITMGGKKYPKDSPVIISYHSFAGRN